MKSYWIACWTMGKWAFTAVCQVRIFRKLAAISNHETIVLCLFSNAFILRSRMNFTNVFSFHVSPLTLQARWKWEKVWRTLYLPSTNPSRTGRKCSPGKKKPSGQPNSPHTKTLLSVRVKTTGEEGLGLSAWLHMIEVIHCSSHSNNYHQ